MGRRLGPGSGEMGRCYVCVRCEPGLSVLMAGPGIWVLFLADTCASDQGFLVAIISHWYVPHGHHKSKLC